MADLPGKRRSSSSSSASSSDLSVRVEREVPGGVESGSSKGVDGSRVRDVRDAANGGGSVDNGSSTSSGL